MFTATKTIGTQNTPLVYYNGAYYYWQGWQKPGTTSMIHDATAEEGVKAIQSSTYTTDTINNKVINEWVRIIK